MSADGFGSGGSDAQQTLQSFWPRVMEEIRNLTLVCYAHWYRHIHAWLKHFISPTKTQTYTFLSYEQMRIHYFQKDFRVQELPLARIKKIMKLDEDVKVIDHK